MKEGTLRARVVAEVHECGRITVNDLMKKMPDYRRDQLQHALDNARRIDLVKLLKKGRTGPNASPGVWGPSDGKNPAPASPRGRRKSRKAKELVCCVWQLGTGGISVPAWQQPAQEYNLLGSWE